MIDVVAKMLPGILYIDSRVGSRELAPLLNQRHGLRTSLVQLESADVAFTCGHSEPSPYCPGDYGCRIGIERKTLSDLVGSLLRNRLGGRQLPLMLATYTFSWVLIEGDYRCGRDDVIETQVRPGIWRPARSTLAYSQLERWLMRYDILGNGKLRRWLTRDMVGSAAWIAATYGWWRKEWKKHTLGVVDKGAMPSKLLLRKPNDYERVVGSFPEIGWKTMKQLTRTVWSVEQLCRMSPGQLQKAGLGKKKAMDLYAFIRKVFPGGR